MTNLTNNLWQINIFFYLCVKKDYAHYSPLNNVQIVKLHFTK